MAWHISASLLYYRRDYGMSKWESQIEPYLYEIEKMARKDMSVKEIADKLGVGYSTFRKYEKSRSELSSAITRGKNHAKKVIDKALAADGQAVQQKSKYTPPAKEPATIYIKAGGVGRPDQNGTHRGAFEKNKKRIYATQEVCGICGRPVDFSLKYPHPMSACIDHKIPVAKGGHPSDISNLQLAHWTCNRQKSDKLIDGVGVVNKAAEVISNRILPQSIDWKSYRSGQ